MGEEKIADLREQIELIEDKADTLTYDFSKQLTVTVTAMSGDILLAPKNGFTYLTDVFDALNLATNSQRSTWVLVMKETTIYEEEQSRRWGYHKHLITEFPKATEFTFLAIRNQYHFYIEYPSGVSSLEIFTEDAIQKYGERISYQLRTRNIIRTFTVTDQSMWPRYMHTWDSAVLQFFLSRLQSDPNIFKEKEYILQPWRNTEEKSAAERKLKDEI